jgi:hypothetical protein
MPRYYVKGDVIVTDRFEKTFEVSATSSAEAVDEAAAAAKRAYVDGGSRRSVSFMPVGIMDEDEMAFERAKTALEAALSRGSVDPQLYAAAKCFFDAHKKIYKD